MRRVPLLIIDGPFCSGHVQKLGMPYFCLTKPLRIIISGGGTGGHIFPAVAIANELRRRQPDAEILFVGANGRMEMTRVPEAGYQIVGLDITGLQRRLTPQNLMFPVRVFRSVRKAGSSLKSFCPMPW